MSKGNASGFIFGTIGMVVGALSWLIVSGIGVGSIMYTAIPVFACIFLICLSTLFYSKKPEWNFLVLGANIFILSMLNYFLGNQIFDQMPDALLGMDGIQESWHIDELNKWFFVMAMSGLIIIFFGLLNRRKSV